MGKTNSVQENTVPKRKQRNCVVCHTREGPLFLFPNQIELRERWKQLCSRPAISKRAEICYRHFKKEEVLRGKHKNKLRATEPSLLLNPVPKSHTISAKNPACSVAGCRNKKQDGVSLHLWPRLFARRQQWATLCKIEKVPKRISLTCSCHFTPSDFYLVDNTRKLKTGAAPSLLLPSEIEPQSSDRASTDGADVNGTNMDVAHVSQPMDQEDRPEPSTPTSGLLPPEDVHLENLPERPGVNDDEGRSFDSLLNKVTGVTVKEVISVFQRLYSSLISDISEIVNSPTTSSSVSDELSAAHCSTDNEEASSGKISVGTQTEARKLNLFDLIHSDTQLKAFTGVTFTTLNIVTKLVLEISDEKCETTMKNKILLTLHKLRLNVSYECVSVLVGFDRRRCGEYFASTLYLLSSVLRHTVYWPSKEEIALNMPLCFSKYRNTRVILDCTEMHVNTPQCLKCKIRTYSHYEGGQAVKILVGVSPSGLITFISKVCGGKVSDNQIFEESDIIKKNLLEPGVDAVMVDKGFRIDKACDERGIKIHRPPFIVKKTPLTNLKAKKNAEIASARVHVERVMQRLKIFQILQNKIAWCMTLYLDDIVTVIAGLVNVGPPILAETRSMTFEKV